MNLVQSLLHFLTATLDKRNCESKDDLEIVFNFCAVWALGSSLGTSDDGVAYRLLLSDFWRANFKAVKFPSRGASTSVFDYWLNPETNVYESWAKSPFMEDVAFDSRRDVMSQITVPTGETCSVNFWMKKMVDQRNAIMCVHLARGRPSAFLWRGQRPRRAPFLTACLGSRARRARARRSR
jgi:dynein heavy chain